LNLSDEVFAWLRGQAEAEIETSCARVFLLPGRALKLKKPVDFGFLDFTTLEKRRWALERELAFNRVTAPDIYRRLVRVTRTGAGFALGGRGRAVDLALEMRRFDPDDVLAEHPERVDGDLAEALGRTIARFHAGAEVRPEGGGVKALGYTIRTNAEHLRQLADRLGAAEVEAVVAATDEAFAAAGPLLERRRDEGFARHCHGDLHLANILVEDDGAPKLFDCIEFNDLLSEIDVLYDLAFLVMDLWFRDAGAAANRALNAYLDEAARSFPPALWDGLAALPVMLSARASVRAHVGAYQGETAAARAYLAAARAHLAPAPARLVAVGGLSGSGKTTFARALAPLIGAAPGAVVLRSDEIRKRLAGVRPTDRLTPDAYAPGTSERVYGEMLALARRALAGGRTVALDAVFLRLEERRAVQALAAEMEVPFQGVWLQGRPEMLTERLGERRGDASDADARVLAEQLTRDPGPMDWRVTDATDPAAAARRIGAGRGAD